MVEMFNKNKSIFDKINDYLTKKGHELVMSVYLNGYNGNNIYIRLDFIKKLSVYKIVWFDLNFFNIKDIDMYVNSQMLTKYLSLKIVEQMMAIKRDGGCIFDDKVIGDRVEIVTYFTGNEKEFVFDRFLPIEWNFLIDPLVLVFSYLPRGMDVFLPEIFAKFDGTEEKYNYLKPIKFDILSSDYEKLFKKHIITRGQKYYEDGRVKFLEKFEDRYLAIVENDSGLEHLVVLHQLEENKALLWCDCKCDFYCKHIYATLKALRKKKFINFYKVKYIGGNESLLDKVTVGNFQICFGVKGDQIMLITSDGAIFPTNIIQKGKVAFEVIEDDDDCSISKKIEELKNR